MFGGMGSPSKHDSNSLVMRYVTYLLWCCHWFCGLLILHNCVLFLRTGTYHHPLHPVAKSVPFLRLFYHMHGMCFGVVYILLVV